MSDSKETTDADVAVEPPASEAQNSEVQPAEMENKKNEEVPPTPTPASDDLDENAAPLADQIDDLQICSQSSQSDAEMQSGPETSAPEFQEPQAPPARKALNPFAVIAARTQSDAEMQSGPETSAPEFQEPQAPPARKALNPFALAAARKTSSLGLLSQYADTDSDSSSSSDDSVVEIKQEYREIEIEDHSSEDESDDDTMSVQSTASTRERRKKKGVDEFSMKDLPPIEELHISVSEQECVELGKITAVIDQLVLIESIPGTVPFDVDTVLFLDKGQRPLGKIFDILGQVASPLYSVRFNSNADIKEKQIEVGATVYVAPKTEHTSFVILSDIMRFKGTDASWKGDFEAPEECVEFSDDEAERQYNQQRRQRDRQNYQPGQDANDGSAEGVEPNKRVRQDNPGRGGGRGRGRGRGRGSNSTAPGNGYGRSNSEQTNPHHSWHSNFQRVPQNSYARSQQPQNNNYSGQYQQRNPAQFQQMAPNYQQYQNNHQYYNGPQPGPSSSSYVNPYAMQQQQQMPPNMSALLSQPPPPPPSSSNNNHNNNNNNSNYY